MSRFFSADWHLNSTAIIQYAGRPFKSGMKMAEAYVRSCNQQARDPNDMIIHVGDFYLKGVDRHGVGDEGLKIPAKEWLSKINAQVFLVEGNHDDSNIGHTHAKQLILDLGPFKNTSVSHYPSTDKGTWTLKGFDKEHLHIHLCGHVHEKWKWKLDLQDKFVLNINVGVDQWKQQIVSEKKLIGYISSLLHSQELRAQLYPEAAALAKSMAPKPPKIWDEDPAEMTWTPGEPTEKW